MKSSDWQKLASLASVITCNDDDTYERTKAIMSHYFYGKIKRGKGNEFPLTQQQSP